MTEKITNNKLKELEESLEKSSFEWIKFRVELHEPAKRAAKSLIETPFYEFREKYGLPWRFDTPHNGYVWLQQLKREETILYKLLSRIIENKDTISYKLLESVCKTYDVFQNVRRNFHSLC